MEKHLTGHQYYMSNYESDDSCSTCDGSRCDCCHERWSVIGTNEMFNTKEKALEVEKAFMTLIPLDGKDYSPSDEHYYYTKDGHLYVTVYVWDDGFTDVLCNEQSPLYAEKFKDAKERKERYAQCQCTDKDVMVNSAPCSKYGCFDSSCYREMKQGKRTEKKEYM